MIIENLDSLEEEKEVQLPSTSAGIAIKRGRPKKLFEVCAPRTKLRKVKTLVESGNLSELTYATQVKLIKSGNKHAANVLEIISFFPRKANEVKNDVRECEEEGNIEVFF